MTFPITAVTMPSDLVSSSNGALPASSLVPVVFPGRGQGFLHARAARAWAAMSSACKTALGVVLTVTSLADAYRSFAIQKSAFLTRMEPVSWLTYIATSASNRRIWKYNGNTYWRLKPGYAACAVPGTSNHGWGLALDTCVLNADGSVTHITIGAQWQWLLDNAAAYGFSWESSEDWHLHYFAGDATPAAVTQSEGVATGGVVWPPFNPAQRQWGIWPIVQPKPVIQLGSTGDPVKYLQGVWGLLTDGNFGPVTQQRVKDAQAFCGLVVDGIVGPQTWAIVDKQAAA